MSGKTKKQAKKNKSGKTGFLPFLPLVFALPGAVAAILGLIVPFAVQLTKRPYIEEIERESRSLSGWGSLHDSMREIGGDGFRFFGAARGFAWAVAIAAGLAFLLLLWSRFDRRAPELKWIVAIGGVLLVLASVLSFVFAVLFAFSAESDGSRVLLSVGAYLTLSGGVVCGVSSFLAVRGAL